MSDNNTPAPADAERANHADALALVLLMDGRSPSMVAMLAWSTPLGHARWTLREVWQV